MRLHTDRITMSNLYRAATVAGVEMTAFTQHASRKRVRAFEIQLSGSSPHRQNNGTGNQAAMWDEWGMFLGALYRIDPHMHCRAYSGVWDFDYQTDDRFAEGPVTVCAHRWAYDGEPYTHSCKKCGAVKRWQRS